MCSEAIVKINSMIEKEFYPNILFFSKWRIASQKPSFETWICAFLIIAVALNDLKNNVLLPHYVLFFDLVGGFMSFYLSLWCMPVFFPSSSFLITPRSSLYEHSLYRTLLSKVIEVDGLWPSHQLQYEAVIILILISLKIFLHWCYTVLH